MKIAHLADLHLGFRQYTRSTKHGINQREADVADAFRRVVDQVIAEQPGLVVVAGDIFHTPRPTNAAIVFAFNQFSRLRAALPNVPVVLVMGNHDRTRSSDGGSILRLFAAIPGFLIFDRGTESVTLHDGIVRITAVPDGGSVEGIAPTPGMVNVLVLHGAVRQRYGGDGAIQDLSFGDGWDYVALGDYHVHQVLAPHICYAGSIEYTSTNPWGELVDERKAGVPGKGFVTFETEAPEIRFHPIATRRHVHLMDINATGMTPDALTAAIADRMDGQPIDGAIVRLTIDHVPVETSRGIDYQALKRYRARAFHLALDFRRPERSEPSIATQFRRMPLEDILSAFLEERFADHSADDRQRLKDMAGGYLNEVSR